MRATEVRKIERRLRHFVEGLFEGEVRDRGMSAVNRYVQGLLLDGDRKSIEPMAERLAADPSDVSALRQTLNFSVSKSPWSEQTVLHRMGKVMLKRLPGLRWYALDDTGFPKKGTESVGVSRQYSGTLGRVDNCQTAVSLHLLGEQGSVCIGFRLYLPEVWAEDLKRRQKVAVPDEIEFATKWRISLMLLDAALAEGFPRWPVLADAGYGEYYEFREELRARKLQYGVGINGSLVFWTPGQQPTPPSSRKLRGTKGRPPSRWKSNEMPASALEIAKGLAYRNVLWRHGTKGPQRSMFAAIRVRHAHKHTRGTAPCPEEWLLCEWPSGEKEPTRLWLCSLPETASLRELVRFVKRRWRIERDYEELKGELGLDHFEGRMWRGFHHHAAFCAVAHAFLVLQRALFPPQFRGRTLDPSEDQSDPSDRAPS